MDKTKRLLFAGVDPGTTTAGAVVDMSGDVVDVFSGKNIDSGSLISRLCSHGSVLVMGTDKAKVPAAVEQLAVKIGAKVYHPTSDLKVLDKKALSEGYAVKNDHERDALAACVLALREHKPLLRKIDVFCGQEGKENLKRDITRLVFRQEVSLVEAARMLDEPERKAAPQEPKMETPMSPKTIWEMRDKIKRLEKDVKLLREHNVDLREQAAKNSGRKKVIRKVQGKELAKQKDKMITALRKELSSVKRENVSRGKEIEKLSGFMLRLRDHYLLKKLGNLGRTAYETQGRALRITEGDVLLVEDPSIMSKAVVDSLKKDVSVIVCRKPASKKLREELPFVVISAGRLHLEETERFALVAKKEIDRETRSLESLRKVIRDYKRERSARQPSWS